MILAVFSEVFHILNAVSSILLKTHFLFSALNFPLQDLSRVLRSCQSSWKKALPSYHFSNAMFCDLSFWFQRIKPAGADAPSPLCEPPTLHTKPCLILRLFNMILSRKACVVKRNFVFYALVQLLSACLFDLFAHACLSFEIPVRFCSVVSQRSAYPVPFSGICRCFLAVREPIFFVGVGFGFWGQDTPLACTPLLYIALLTPSPAHSYKSTTDKLRSGISIPFFFYAIC